MSTRQERALNAICQRGRECVPGTLVDLTMLIDILAAADGASFTTVAALGTPGDYIELKPPGSGDFSMIQAMFEGGEIDNTVDPPFDAAPHIYTGQIRSGDTPDAREVWAGSTGQVNRTSALQLSPDSRLYVNTDPLRVAGLRIFSQQQPLKIALGNCTAFDATCVSVLLTLKCLGASAA